jgi:hypothetical protein
MKISEFQRPETSFVRRVLRTALTWGVPILCMELIGVPRRDWGWILVLAAPGTLLGVVVYAGFEHWLARRRRSRL